jgi:hypothetical protein
LLARDRFKIKKLELYSNARHEYSNRIENTLEEQSRIEEKNKELELKEAEYIKQLHLT